MDFETIMLGIIAAGSVAIVVGLAAYVIRFLRLEAHLRSLEADQGERRGLSEPDA